MMIGSNTRYYLVFSLICISLMFLAAPSVSGEEYHLLWEKSNDAEHAAVSRDGQYVVFTNETGIYFHVWNSSKPLWWYTESGLRDVAISADGDHVIANVYEDFSSNYLYYWNNSKELSGSQAFTWSSKSLLLIEEIDISDNGTFVALSADPEVGEVYYYNESTKKSGADIGSAWNESLGIEMRISTLDLSANGKYLAIGGVNSSTSSGEGFVKFYKDAWNGETSCWYNDSIPIGIVDVVVSDDGYAVSALDSEENSIFYWADSTQYSGSPAADWTQSGAFYVLDSSSDGDEVAAVTGSFASLYFWDGSRTRSGDQTETWSKSDPSSHTDVAVNDDGTLVAATGGALVEGSLIIYSSDGTIIYDYSRYGYPPTFLDMSGEGDVLVAGGSIMVFALSDVDYGDAPDFDEYWTVNGARHLLDGLTFLGSAVDPDSNGQPDLNALGDDNDGQDDEDGVVFTSPIIQGATAYLDVTASRPGYLNAWVDFDGDYMWEPGEKVFTGESLSAGLNNLQFQVPKGSNSTTFARFRFSTVEELNFWEYAPDGEVEDYKIQIQDPPVLTGENPGIKDRTLNITACNEFGVEIWVRNITDGLSMVGFDFLVEWDPALTEYVGHQVFDHGWDHSFNLDEAGGSLWFDYPVDTGHTSSQDDIWLNITFHCLGEGVSEVNVSSIDTIWLWDDENQPFGIDPAPYSILCNQTSAPLPESDEVDAVGGELLKVNTLVNAIPILLIAVSIIAVLKGKVKEIDPRSGNKSEIIF